MAKNFNELLAKMSPERRARIEARVQETIAQMPLEELRNARELTQTQLADVLHVSQGAISKVERRTDMYISTLRSYIRAIGGDLRIQAVFPDGAVEIDQMQPAAPRAFKFTRLGRRIFVEDRRLRHVAAHQPYAASFSQIDRGKDVGCHCQDAAHTQQQDEQGEDSKSIGLTQGKFNDPHKMRLSWSPAPHFWGLRSYLPPVARTSWARDVW